MVNPQQFDRLCRIVALLIRRTLETDKAVCPPEDAGAPPRRVADAGQHTISEEVVE